MTQNNDLEKRLQDIELWQNINLAFTFGIAATMGGENAVVEKLQEYSYEAGDALDSEDLDHRAEIIKKGRNIFERRLR
jgi:hypothetical protein